MTRHARARGAALALLLMSAPALAAPVGGPDTPKAADRQAWQAAVSQRFGPDARLSWDGLRAVPTAITRIEVQTLGAGPAARALHFCAAHRDLLGLAPGVELALAETKTFRDGATVRLDVRLGGLDVEGVRVAVSLDHDGDVRSVRLDPAPRALAAATTDVGRDGARAAVTARFGVTAVGNPTRVALWRGVGPARPAWRVPTALVPWVAHFYVWVDAETGAVVGQAPVSNDQPLRRLEVAR